MKKCSVVDLCCGMGGLSYAAQQSGLTINIGIDTADNALRSYKENFPAALAINGDVADINVIRRCIAASRSNRKNSEKLIVLSGPPCQGFSDAGPRCADDPRNQVLVAVAKAIVSLRPEGALVENVHAIRHERNARIVRRFRAILNSAGYHVYGFELNAIAFGVPQNRRRMFFFILPFMAKRRFITQGFKTFQKKPHTVLETIGDLPMPPIRDLPNDPNNDREIANHRAMQHSEKVRNKIASIQQGKGPLSYRKLDPNSCACTLISGHRAPPVHYEQPRSITVREALRLQGFPDSFHVMGPFGSQMGQVTNAVPPPLTKAALGVLFKLLGEDR